MPNRIAILVLGCASPPYDVMIETIRNTWGDVNVPGVDIFYLYGNPHDDHARTVLSRYVGSDLSPVADNEIRVINDVLIAGCADNFGQQHDCILRKRLIAFGYLSSARNYDLIYTVCATSYVDQYQLIRHANRLTPKRLISGALGIDPAGTPFVSGASMLLSADLARKLSNDRLEIIEQNQFGSRDDVSIGHWIVTRMSNVPLETFAHDIRMQNLMTPDHIFMSYPHTTVDYVMASAERHQSVADAFHYHFHSLKPGHMMGFHRRYFTYEL